MWGGQGWGTLKVRIAKEVGWRQEQTSPARWGPVHSLQASQAGGMGGGWQDVTAQQAKERADSRRLDGQPPITSFFQTVNGGGRDAVQQSGAPPFLDTHTLAS